MKMKRIIQALLLSIVCVSLSSFTIDVKDWQLVHEQADIKVYAKTMQCGIGNWFAFKFENEGNEIVEFDYLLNEEKNVTFGNLKGHAIVQPKSSKECDCKTVSTMALPNNMESELPLAERLQVKIEFNQNTKQP